MNYLKNLFTSLSNYNRRIKQLILLIFDIICLNVSLFLSYSLRFEIIWPISYISQDYWLFIVLPIITIPLFVVTGLYRAVLEHIGIKTAIAVLKSISLSTLILSFMMMMGREVSSPRSIFIIYGFISTIFILGLRYIAHFLIYSFSRSSNSRVTVAIFGAGKAGVMLAESIQESSKFILCAMFDDDENKHGTIINSNPVFSSKKIEETISNLNIKIVLLAIPSLGKSHRLKILNRLSKFPIRVMELPSIENIIDGEVTIEHIKEVQVEDLLGRASMQPIDSLLNKNIKGKNVLVTGAGGSIGSELCKQILDLQPNLIILYEQSEFNLYSIHSKLEGVETNCKIIPVLASIQNRYKLEAIFKNHEIDTVYHAAAYKHVPMVESNPCDGVWNNIVGTYRLANKALEYKVELFVLISTDKAVRPTNVMGATKRFSELILQGLNEAKESSTKFTMVRFGNVLDSAGSVLPLFRNQIKSGGPLTVTHPEVIRYFMSIPEASQLVIQAGAMSVGGDVFLLDMGNPVNILDMAKKMIHLSGLEIFDKETGTGDIKIKITGLRPGEKLYEELLIGENSQATEHPRIMKAHEEKLTLETVSEAITDFQDACKKQDNEKVMSILNKYVAGFKSNINE
ncbi:polysaccharide biosynthesis protein [bacterium]|nr:polysaccharide biosynthesis protein [bacterium]